MLSVFYATGLLGGLPAGGFANPVLALLGPASAPSSPTYPGQPALHGLSLLPIGRVTVRIDPLTGASIPYVYQRVRKGFGNIAIPGSRDLQLRRLTASNPPPTPGQSARRALFGDAVAAWQSADEPTRAEYRQRARAMSISGYNLFLREFMAT